MYSLEKLSFCIKVEEKGIAQYIELEKNWQEIFNINKVTIQFLVFSLFFLANLYIFSSFFLSILFFFLFKFWQDFYQNFNLSKIYYEESSWFDNKIWQKNLFLIKKDKIFSKQKIKKKVSLFYRIMVISIINTILLFFVFSI
jgi:hypothetical protein